MDCVEGYRINATRLESFGVLDTWYLHAYPGRSNPVVNIDPKARAVIDKTVAKAKRTDNHALLAKVTEKQGNGKVRFRMEPPILTKIDKETREAVIDGLNRYAPTLPRDRRYMLARYQVIDVCHRIVGVGSVGTRAYLVLLFGNDDSDRSLPAGERGHCSGACSVSTCVAGGVSRQWKACGDGAEILAGSSDVMLGHTQIGGRDFFVRQMKNLKASIPIEWLTGSAFNFYARAMRRNPCACACPHGRCGPHRWILR